eukprot:COSAG06_NODE_46978_length_342_cov_2.123457_1_plen_84_part_10
MSNFMEGRCAQNDNIAVGGPVHGKVQGLFRAGNGANLLACWRLTATVALQRSIVCDQLRRANLRRFQGGACCDEGYSSSGSDSG